MKAKKFNKKLLLNKVSISNLNPNQAYVIRGGVVPVVTDDNPVVTCNDPTNCEPCGNTIGGATCGKDTCDTCDMTCYTCGECTKFIPLCNSVTFVCGNC